MKIFLTGANSFLGTYYRIFNKKENFNFIFGTTSSIKGKNFLKFKSLYKDINYILKNHTIDVIIHLAAIIPNNFNEADYNLFKKNIEMMNYLYNFSLKKKLKKFIYISGFGSITTSEQLDIKDFYTMSKIVGEYFCSMMNTYGIQATSLRISSPYGEFMKRKTVINIFLEKALKNEDILVFGTGKREQNFIYAGDIVRAINLVLEKNIKGFYEIVSDRNINMLNLAKLIVKLTNSSSKIIVNNIPDPQEDYRPRYSYQKAFKTFGFRPKYSLEDGLNRLIKWYKKK